MTTSTCCGGTPQRRSARHIDPLPPNPTVSGGVRLIYLASGDREVKGRASGLTYFVSSTRRYLTVDRDDAAQFLGDRAFIRKP